MTGVVDSKDEEVNSVGAFVAWKADLRSVVKVGLARSCVANTFNVGCRASAEVAGPKVLSF